MSDGSSARGVCTTDLSLIVQSWDAWLAEATGVAEADARGRALSELVPDLEARGLLARLRRVGESGMVEVLAPAFHEYLIPCRPRVHSPHFTRMQQHVTLAPLHAGASVVGIMITIEDVTARRARERDLAIELQSEDDGVRLHAVRALAAEEEGAAHALAAALGDQSWRVRRVAAEGLARAPDDGVTEDLIAAVRERHTDPGVLNAALTALATAQRDVVPSVVPLLDSRDTDVRTYGALALGLLGDPRAVGTLVRALDDDDANVRFHALEALGRIGSRAAVLPVAAVAESRDFSVAFAALDTLALIGEPSIAPRLVPLLDDSLLQVAAVEALGRLGSEDAVAPLAALLDQPGSPVTAVAGALAALHERAERSHAPGTVVADLARAVITMPGTRALLAALDGASTSELCDAIVVLGWLDGDGIDDALAGLMTNPEVQRTAALTLSARGAGAVPALLGVLRTGDDEACKAAASALGRLGAAGAVPALIPLLEGAADVAVVAAMALGAIGDPRAFEPLLALLDHPHATVRQASIAALNSLGHPDTPERARALFGDPAPHLREAAAKLAGYLGHDDALDAVLALCDDADEAVRRTAVEQLPHFEGERARAGIARALESGSAGVRAASARALAHVRAEDALPLLARACRDADPWVRYYAARSLGRLGRRDATPLLVGLARDDAAPPVRIAAVESLAEIGDTESVAALLPLATDPDGAVAAPVMLALGGVGHAPVLPVLVEALASDDRARRLAALEGIARLGDPAAVPPVAAIARAHSDPELREGATSALARIGDARAVAALVALADEPKRGAEVVEALGRLGDEQVPSIALGLGHPSVGVRCVVVEALGRMRSPLATGPLSEALHDDDATVRLAAAHALARLDLRATTSNGE